MSRRYPIYHKDECGEIGLYTTIEDPQIGEPLLARDFFHTDGTKCYPLEEPTCGHCGRRMFMRIEWIDYDNPVEVPDA